MLRSFSMVIYSGFLAGSMLLAPIQETQAGIIPWTWDALFGPPGSLQQWAAGYPNGNPYLTGGYGGLYGATTSFYAPSYAHATNYYSGYAPSSYGYTTNYGYGANYGYGNGACCNPCACSPCGGCSDCGVGGCATGDCGVSSNYSPEPTAEPTTAEPTTPSDTRTFQKKPLTDDFVPTTKPLPEEEVVPDTGGFVRPAPMEPLDFGNPGSLNPLNEESEVLPNGINPGGSGSDRGKALKPTTDVQPLNLDFTIVGEVTPQRRRIIMNTSYRIPSVVRVHTQPSQQSIVADTKIAAK